MRTTKVTMMVCAVACLMFMGDAASAQTAKVVDNSKASPGGITRKPGITNNNYYKLKPRLSITSVVQDPFRLRVRIENKGNLETQRQVRLSTVVSYVTGSPAKFLGCVSDGGKISGWSTCYGSSGGGLGIPLPKLEPGGTAWIDVDYTPFAQVFKSLVTNWESKVPWFAGVDKKDVRLGIKISLAQNSYADQDLDKKFPYAELKPDVIIYPTHSFLAF